MDANFIFGLIFMTGTGGSIYGIELYLSFCVGFEGFIMWFYYVVLLCGFQKTIKCL